MKKQISFLLISSLIPFSAFADFKSLEEAETKLAVYTVTDIKDDKARVKEGKKLKIDEMFNDLEDANKFAEKNPISETLAYQMQRVSLITFVHDPTFFAIGLIYPTYNKNLDLFNKASQRLHPYDRKLLQEVYKGKDQLEKDGNG